MKRFTPVFEKDGHRLIVLMKDFCGDSEDQARKIGYGAMLVECILMQMKHKFEIIEIPEVGIPHVKTDIQGCPVALLSGPIFDEAVI